LPSSAFILAAAASGSVEQVTTVHTQDEVVFEESAATKTVSLPVAMWQRLLW